MASSACWGERCSAADMSELDAALQQDKESLYHQRLAVDTVEISPKELWRLNRQQQAAQAAAAQHGGAGGCRALCGRSVLGMPLLQERSRVSAAWLQLMMLMDLSYTTFYIPFTLVLFERYDVEASRDATALFAIDAVFGAFFFANLLLQLHIPVRVSASFYQLLLHNGWGVFKVYRRQGTFWIDLATALPWLLQVAVPFTSRHDAKAVVVAMLLLRMVRLLRVVRLVKLLARGELFPHSSSRYMTVSGWYMLSLCFCAAATINLLACIWYATAKSGSGWGDGNETDSWLSSVGGRDLTGAPKMVKYLTAVYFTVTTITTTGYGDITPKNEVETAVAILVMLIGALFMSYLIGTVAGMLNKSSADARRSEEFRIKVAHLDGFFQSHNASAAVEREVYRYYYYVYTRCKQEDQQWGEVAGDLPTGLRGRLVLSLLRSSCRGLMEQLGAGVPEAVLLLLCASMERRILSPGHNLAAAGAPADSMWLLRHGSVLAAHPDMLVSAVLGSLLTGELTMQPHRAADAAVEQQQDINSSGTSKHIHSRSAASWYDSLPLFHRPRQATVAAAAGDGDGGAAAVNQTRSSKVGLPADVSIASFNGDTNRQPDALPAASDEEAAAAAAAAAAETTQQVEQDRLLKIFTGPCLFPDYAMHWHQQQQQQQQTHMPPQSCQQPNRDAADTGNGSSPRQSSSRGSCQDTLERVHPVWLRTQGLCVVYRMDAAVVRQLCGACPQLAANLQLLLQPI